MGRTLDLTPYRFVLAIGLVAFVLYNTSIITGFTFSETLRDLPAWGTALSFQGVIIVFFKLHGKVPDWLSTVMFLILILIWAYISYHFLAFEDYSFKDIPGDIADSFANAKANPKKALIWISAFAIAFGVPALRGKISAMFHQPVKDTGRDWLSARENPNDG